MRADDLDGPLPGIDGAGLLDQRRASARDRRRSPGFEHRREGHLLGRVQARHAAQPGGIDPALQVGSDDRHRLLRRHPGIAGEIGEQQHVGREPVAAEVAALEGGLRPLP